MCTAVLYVFRRVKLERHDFKRELCPLMKFWCERLCSLKEDISDPIFLSVHCVCIVSEEVNYSKYAKIGARSVDHDLEVLVSVALAKLSKA
jgi:hypothetical protein